MNDLLKKLSYTAQLFQFFVYFCKNKKKILKAGKKNGILNGLIIKGDDNENISGNNNIQ